MALEYSSRLLMVQDYMVLVHMVQHKKSRPKSQNSNSPYQSFLEHNIVKINTIVCLGNFNFLVRDRSLFMMEGARKGSYAIFTWTNGGGV